MNNLEKIKNLDAEKMAELLTALITTDKTSLDSMACSVCPYYKKRRYCCCTWDKENNEKTCYFGTDDQLVMKTVLESETFDLLDIIE